MQESIFKAYVWVIRRRYPDESRRNNDEKMFHYAIENEENVEVLHELKYGLENELTSKLIEFRRKQRKKWFSMFLLDRSRKRHTLPEGALYENAIAKISERLDQLQKIS